MGFWWRPYSNLVTIKGVALFEIILVWIHLTAATFWVGGMFFLSLVAVPLLKKAPDPALAQREFVNHARRFRIFVWVALSLLVVTGGVLLPRHLDSSIPLASWPIPVLLKLILVAVLVMVSLLHDRVFGSRVPLIKRKPPAERTRSEQVLIRLSPLIGRLTMLLGLVILLVAVIMVRT